MYLLQHQLTNGTWDTIGTHPTPQTAAVEICRLPRTVKYRIVKA